MLASSALVARPAYAVDGTWLGNNPGDPSQWVEGANWSSTPVVPDGTATFTNNGAPTTVQANGTVDLSAITFTASPNAPAYTITMNNAFTVTGSGVSNNSTSTQTFDLATGSVTQFSNSASASAGATAVIYTLQGTATVAFNNSSTAGTATINSALVGGSITFNGTSNAGTANIVLKEANLVFNNASSAGSATITMPDALHPGTITFNNTSTAANSNITVVGSLGLGSSLSFLNSSTAGNATLTTVAGHLGGGEIFFGTLSGSGGTDTSDAGTAHILNNGGTTSFLANTSASNATITNGSTTTGNTNFQDQSTAANATIVNNNGGATTFGVQLVGTDTATAGNANITNQAGGLTDFNASTTAGNAVITTNNGGTVSFVDSSTGGTARFITNAGGTFDMSGLTAAGMTAGSIEGAGSYLLGGKSLTVGSNNLSTTVSGIISGVGGSLTKVGTGTLTLSGANSYSGGTTISAGAVAVGNNAALGTGAVVMNDGTTLQKGLIGTAITLANNFALTGAGSSVTFDTNNDLSAALIISGTISGAGNLVKSATNGNLALTNAESYTGSTIINGGRLALRGSGSIAASSGVTLSGTSAFDIAEITAGSTSIRSLAGSSNTTVFLGGKNLILTGATGLFSGTLRDGSTQNGYGGPTTGGQLTLASGTEILAGTNTYTGSTTVNGGVLEVDGSIANSSNVVVNSGGTLGGTGIVDPATTTIMSGGTLAPGSVANPTGTLTITGNLAFQSGAIYLVQVGSSAASQANVTGSATPGGATVDAIFMPSAMIRRQYTILQATGGVTGTFAPQVVSNAPAFQTSLSYSPNTVFLNVNLNFTALGGLNINQTNVANALNGYFNANGGIPAVYGGLTPAGLTQASGELATGVQQTTFNAMNLFMGTMTDPFVAGRGGSVAAPGTAPAGYASDNTAVRAAYDAVFTKAPLATVYDPHWSLWAAGYGGSQTTSGNAVVGSNDTTSRVFATAVGADYLLSPSTIMGFALAGGGTNFSVNNSGSGHSDLFQAGAFARHSEGNAYVKGALAYGWQDVTTNRLVTAAGFENLRAEFNANTFAGRIEGGYRYATPWMGITPYAAAQFTTIDLPAYAEQVLAGAGNFALNYNARDVTDARSELGLRFDKSFAMSGGVLTLRERLAWAHDYDPNRTIAATFQALPGASFVVNGAAQASDSALTTLSAEMKWMNGWSAAATFEGEFSGVTSSYAGKGVVRYTW